MVGLDLQALDAEYEALRHQGIPGISINQLAFSIMHGNGNVILVVDEALSSLSSNDIGSDLARALCEAFRTVRVDGISFVRTTTKPIRMIYFDRDGTRSSMCGNGLRCVTQYGIERGYLRVDSDTVITDDGPKWVSAAGGNVRASVGWGKELQQIAAGRYFVFSGVPHLVVLLGDSDDLNAIDVKAEGASLRYDHQLSRRLNHPEGLNVNFMQRHGDGIHIRSYEVGVEDETLACGTGAAGCAYVASRVWRLQYPLRVEVRLGEICVEETENGLIISGITGHLFARAPATVSPDNSWALTR
jgi:diaminopimelate epimerase